MTGILEWYASIAGMLAALMIAWNHSKWVSGWGFVLFTTCSTAWIAYGFLTGEDALAVQNVVLTFINLLGIYRYLWLKKNVD